MSKSDPERFGLRWNAICIDCSPEEYDAEVSLYCGLLGTEVAEREQRWAALQDPQSQIWLNIQADDSYVRPTWPEQVSAQTKMMHFEVRVDDVPAAVTLVTSFGAREAAQQPSDRDPTRLRVMLDPAGHPFCLWS